ncbi:hypothetical protein AB0T83_11760 [Fluviibacterium sp. DFM31]|uniref:Uncharacterized protein n=1 Tax=Meridianimarinicoccus marinus TaxID=3231483 RepID=A0ABV3L7A8_9RHOB
MTETWGFWLDDRMPRQRRDKRTGSEDKQAAVVSTDLASDRRTAPEPTRHAEARMLQAQYGNHAVGEMVRAAGVSRQQRAETPMEEAIHPPAPVETARPEGHTVEPVESTDPPVPETEAKPAPDRRPEPDDTRPAAMREAPPTALGDNAQAPAISGFLAALERDPAHAPWAALSAVLSEAPERLLDRTAQAVVARAHTLDARGRKVLQEAMARAEREKLLPDFLPRLRARLATLAPHGSEIPPSPPPDPPP